MTNDSIRKNAEEFIIYKRSLGYTYDGFDSMLDRYIRYVEKAVNGICYPEKNVTDEYLKSISHSGATMYQTVCVLREFSRYLQLHGNKEVYVIPPKTTSLPVPEAPYFFTEKEIEAFFKSLDDIQPNKSFKGREYVFPALFRLLHCCGLRCKEARILECKNVHTSEFYIDIIQSKGPKSRRIFIGGELAEYLDNYNARIDCLFPRRKYYFPHGNSYYGTAAISENFKRYWKKAFPDFVITTRPRAYDFRHHFAWANLNRWAADGLDLNVMLPYLMRYMGHQNVSETLYYFHFVPEFFPTYKDLAKPFENLIPEVPYEE